MFVRQLIRRHFGGKRSWLENNKNSSNLYVDLGHLIGRLRKKGGEKSLRTWSEDSRRLDVVVFEDDRQEELRFDHDDVNRVLNALHPNVAAPVISVLWKKHDLRPSDDKAHLATGVLAEGGKWKEALELFNTVLGTVDNGTGLIGAREPTDLVRRYEELREMTDMSMLFGNAILACSRSPRRPMWSIAQNILDTMRVCGYEVRDEHVLDVMKMTAIDNNHYETIMTFLQWAHIGVDIDYRHARIVMNACIVSESWSTMVDILNHTKWSEDSKTKILKELIRTLHVSGHVRVLLPILESMASEFRTLLFSRDREMQKNATKLLTSAIEAHAKVDEYDSVLWLTKFVRQSADISNMTTSDVKSLMSYATKHEILALCESKEWDTAYDTYLHAININTKISSDTFELVSQACLQIGRWREANDVLTSCSNPSIGLMSNVIECCSRSGGVSGMKIALDVLERCASEYLSMSQNVRAKKRNFDPMKSSFGNVLIAACSTSSSSSCGKDDDVKKKKRRKKKEIVPGGMERVVFGEPARTERGARANAVKIALEMLGVNEDRQCMSYKATRDFFRGKSQKSNMASLIEKIENIKPSKALSSRDTLIRYCKTQNQREPRFSFERVSEREVRCRLMFPSGPLSRTLSMDNDIAGNDDDDDDDILVDDDDADIVDDETITQKNVNLSRALKTMYAFILDLDDRARFAKRFVPSKHVTNEMLRAAVRSENVNTSTQIFEMLKNTSAGEEILVRDLDFQTLRAATEMVLSASDNN